MNYQHRYITNIHIAEKAASACLLNRRSSSNTRLLHATKLTDMILQSFIAEDATIVKSPLDYPIDFINLTADLFTALFSPTIRRRDMQSVQLHHRVFHAPIIDSIATDDRFETLKRLCEDKELPSYEAAKAFHDTLACHVPAQLQGKNYEKIIAILHQQIEQSQREVHKQKAPGNGNEKRLLHLYNRIIQKTQQIADLEKKVEEQALLYIQSLGPAIGKAIDAAIRQALEVNMVMSAWGNSDGNMQNTPVNHALMDYVKNNEQLMQIARMLGRYKEIIATKRKNSYAYGRGEKYDLSIGNDITNCLSGELALLGTAETEILFMRKYEQKRLQQYRKRMQIIKGRGDMIVLVDESSSTSSVAGWAKAFALALLDIAAKDHRKYALIHFANASHVKTDLFEPGHYRSEDMMRAAEHFFGGGTDFEAPLTEAISLMEKGYERADIIIITDGECQISDEFAIKLRQSLSQYKATITGILLDKNGNCGSSLVPFCDSIYHSNEMTEDDIATQVLNKRME